MCHSERRACVTMKGIHMSQREAFGPGGLMGRLRPISDDKRTSWFQYVCDEIGPNITISNHDARYMMIHFYTIDTDNDIFLAIHDIFDTSLI
jgi:hypothetical protein